MKPLDGPVPMPAWFLAHGAPLQLLADSPVRRFWSSLPDRLPAPPKVLLCLSAHWLTETPTLAGHVPQPTIQYDFHGFPDELYRLSWPLHHNPARLKSAIASIAHCVPELAEEAERPLDHGVWVPLMAAWSEPPFPVLQLSLCPQRGTRWHWELGRKLAPLREKGILVVGSGGLVHNLSRLDFSSPDGTAADWARAFIDALCERLAAGDTETLLDPRHLPHGCTAVPTIEHYLPWLVILGTAGEDPAALRLMHESWAYGALAMHSFELPQAGSAVPSA